jgi:hypothetical protein
MNKKLLSAIAPALTYPLAPLVVSPNRTGNDDQSDNHKHKNQGETGPFIGSSLPQVATAQFSAM